MKRFIHSILSLFFLISVGMAQATAPKSLFYTFPTVSAVGPLGNGLTLDNQTIPRPSNYTIDVSVNGTAPTACTFRVEGSSDGTNWYGLDVTAPATNSCTAGMMEHIANKPVLILRINIVAYTGTTGTVVFHYTGAGQ